MASYTGEAMAMGERTPIALLNAPASGRMAIGECLTNMAASYIGSIQSIKLSANWMVAAGEDGEDANLYDTVSAVGMELCPLSVFVSQLAKTPCLCELHGRMQRMKPSNKFPL